MTPMKAIVTVRPTDRPTDTGKGRTKMDVNARGTYEADRKVGNWKFGITAQDEKRREKEKATKYWTINCST